MKNQDIKKSVSDIAFSPTVKKYQQHFGSRRGYEKMEAKGGFRDRITEDLLDFVAERDSFYFATASKDGQPYIQHRGGAKGFLKVVDPHTFAFADYKGNKQYITIGNLTDNDKAYIFLMDYPNRMRVKVWGTAQVVEDRDLLEKLTDTDYLAKIERAIVFTVKMIDINCPQHIQPRYTQQQLQPTIDALQTQIQKLQQENAELRKAMC